MTVSTIDSVVEYVAGGPAFPIPYRFLQDSDIEVVLVKQDGSSETLVLGTQYTLVGAGAPNGGTLTSTYASGVLATPGATLSISRVMEPTQETDLRNQGRYFAETHENVFDRLTMLVQQGFSIFKRALSRPSGKNYFYAEDRRIANVADPTEPQDAATSGWVDQFVGGIISAIQGPINNALNVFFLGPDGSSHVVQDLSGPSGSDLVGFIQTGTGAVPRTLLSKARDQLNANDFGVVADGIVDDTEKLQLAINVSRLLARPLGLSKGVHRTTSALDVSGATLIGSAGGYRNENGTIIQGDGTHDILVQVTASASDTRIDLTNLRLKNGLWGVKVRYLLHSRWSNVHVTDSQNGFQIGNSDDAGSLFNTFENLETKVVDTGLDLNGNGYVNSNSFSQCMFEGDQFGGRIRCVGGIGAIGNMFNCTEFLGNRYGVTLQNTNNTTFNSCYFESLGPAVGLLDANLGWSLNDCVFANLRNDNSTGKTSYIYHFAGQVNRGSVKGGFVYIPSGAVYDNQRLIASEDATKMFVTMPDEPDLSVAAAGFQIFDVIPSENLSYSKVTTYTPSWSSGTIGNGTLRGRWVREGNIVTVSIFLSFGSTTNPGASLWSFGLPFTARESACGTAVMTDSGNSIYLGGAVVGAGTNTCAININASANYVGPTVPFTWGNADGLIITITYQC